MTKNATTRWLTFTEACEHIRATDERIIRAAIKAGDLPAYKYGAREVRLTADDLDAWMRSKPFED